MKGHPVSAHTASERKIVQSRTFFHLFSEASAVFWLFLTAYAISNKFETDPVAGEYLKCRRLPFAKFRINSILSSPLITECVISKLSSLSLSVPVQITFASPKRIFIYNNRWQTVICGTVPPHI